LDSGSESAGAETSLVDESRVELGVCGDEGVQDESLGLQLPRHWAVYAENLGDDGDVV